MPISKEIVRREASSDLERWCDTCFAKYAMYKGSYPIAVSMTKTCKITLTKLALFFFVFFSVFLFFL